MQGVGEKYPIGQLILGGRSGIPAYPGEACGRASIQAYENSNFKLINISFKISNRLFLGLSLNGIFSSQQQQQQITRPLQFGKNNYPAPPAAEFKTHEEFEFYRIGNSSYRATVNTIENIPYVCLSNWWFNRATSQWCPSRKQISIPKSAWLALRDIVELITLAIKPFSESDLASATPRQGQLDSDL